MIKYQKDDFDGSFDDIMNSVNDILNKTGEWYETAESNEKRENEKNNEKR